MTIEKHAQFTCSTDAASTYTFTGKTKKPRGLEHYVNYQFIEKSKYHTQTVWRNEGCIKSYFTAK